LALLGKLAEQLGIETGTLLLLAFPELKAVLAKRNEVKSGKQESAWERFASNHALLRRHKVTPDELNVLKRISMLGRVPCVDHFLFVLTSIRQATTPVTRR
jgi:hypothetical protein